MKIIETTIPDVTEENLNQKKVQLADVIVSSFQPLLGEMQVKRSKEEEVLISEVESNKQRISKGKDEIRALLNDYEREKKIKEALEVVSKVDPVKLEYNRSLKNEVVVFLRIIEKLSLEKLSSYLQDILKVSDKTINNILSLRGRK